jgi:hypothetical protein
MPIDVNWQTIRFPNGGIVRIAASRNNDLKSFSLLRETGSPIVVSPLGGYSVLSGLDLEPGDFESH